MKTALEIISNRLSSLPTKLKGEIVRWDKQIDDAIIEAMKDYALETIDAILEDPSMIYVELDGEANYSYEAFEKFKQQIL